MSKVTSKKIQTDEDVKRKAVKLVIAHLKKKASSDFLGVEHVRDWIADMEDIMAKAEFNIVEYHQMRRELNDVIERILDEEMRFKVRDSWYSMGKALDKKVKR